MQLPCSLARSLSLKTEYPRVHIGSSLLVRHSKDGLITTGKSHCMTIYFFSPTEKFCPATSAPAFVSNPDNGYVYTLQTHYI